jgi:hypothetical protein
VGAAVVAVAVVLAGAGCGSSPDDRRGAPATRYAAIGGGGEAWRTLQRTMDTKFDENGSNACVRGDRTCVPSVVAEMRRRYGVLAEDCSHLAPFALMYLRVTAGVKDAKAGGQFKDLAYLAHLDAVFADLYFGAFDAWRAHRDHAVPEAWRLAFEAGERKVVAGIGDLMLGMNAHISRDLPFALASSGLAGTAGQSAKPDFDAVNSLLDTTAQPMVQEQTQKFDPSIGRFTAPAFGISALNLGALLGMWRTEAYQNAEKLLSAPDPATRAKVAAAIEHNAAQRARLIEVATSYAVLGGGPKGRRAFCERRVAGAGA